MDAEKRLTLSLGVTAVLFLAEVIGGIVSNSLALLSDAGHIFTDAFAISLSIIAARIGRRPSDHRATYGYQRIGLLAAVINGLSLLLISSFVKPGSSDLVDYYNHFSLLAGIEDLFGLKHLGYASDPALPRFDGATYNANKPG